MHAQRVQTHRSCSTSRSSTSTECSRRMRQTPSTWFFLSMVLPLRRVSRLPSPQAGKPQRSHTHSAQCLPSRFNINAQHKKVVHINNGKNATDLFSFRWYFLCSEYQASSSSARADHPQRLHTQFGVPSMLALFSSSSPSYCRSSGHRSTDGAKSGGERGGERGGGGRQREAEPLAPKPNVTTWQAPAVGACRWKRRPRRDGRLGGPNDTKNVTLQIGNNRLSILVTVSRIHSHSKTGKLNVVSNNPCPGEQ